MGVDQRGVEILHRLAPYVDEATKMLSLGRQHVDYENSLLGGQEWLDVYQGATVTSLDVSPYEGAKIVADLQDDLPANLYESQDVVLDFGTAEHIYDVSRAYDNIFKLLRPGGLYVGLNGRTGWNSHGLYQFTPEFAFTLAQKYSAGLECYTVRYGDGFPIWWHYKTYGHDPREVWSDITGGMTYLAVFLRKGEQQEQARTVTSLRYAEHLHLRTGEMGNAVVEALTVAQFVEKPLL